MADIKETSWIEEELKQLQTPTNFETLPALKLQPNKLAEIEVDISKPFGQWIDPTSKAVKAIIPVTFQGQKLNFWLNKRNPLYHQLMDKAKTGITKFKILQTGTQKDTRYNLVD